MKLPVLWIAAAFSAGILLVEAGPTAFLLAHWAHPVASSAAAAIAAIGVGAALTWRRLTIAAWVCALLVWCVLGTFAATLERATVPADHVAKLVAAGKLDTSIPLRWRGRLRNDPELFPWGHRYEIDLEQVETAGATVPVKGGLRLNLYGRSENSEESYPESPGAPPPARGG